MRGTRGSILDHVIDFPRVGGKRGGVKRHLFGDFQSGFGPFLNPTLEKKYHRGPYLGGRGKFPCIQKGRTIAKKRKQRV